MENANDPSTTTRPWKPTAAATDCPPTDPLARFRAAFPTGASVYAWFAPAHWERFASGITPELTLRPCPTLDQVAGLYADPSLPRSIIRAALHGLASLAPSSYAATPQAIDITVSLFARRYGSRCTLYQLMAYAANYQDYKRTLAAFDLNDILQAYPRFEAKWGEILDQARRLHGHDQPADPHAGLYALAAYIRRACTLHPDGIPGFCRDSSLVRQLQPTPGLQVHLLGTFLPTQIAAVARASTTREAMAILKQQVEEAQNTRSKRKKQ